MVLTLLLPADGLPRVSPEQVDAAVRGQLRLRWESGGQIRALLSALRPVDRQLFEHAKCAGYVVLRRPQSDLARAWLLWCDASNQPFIRVALADPKYVSIDLELLPGRGSLTERAIVRLRLLVREIGGESEWLDEHVCRVGRVPQQHLESMAAAMRSIALTGAPSP